MYVPLTSKIPRVPEPLDFDWLAEDRDWPVLELTVTPADVERWARLHDDFHPWYFGPSPWGGPVAPVTIFYYPGQNAFPPRRDFAGVLAALGLEAHRPIFVGSTLEAHTRITDRWRRGERAFVSYRLDIYGQGELVAVSTRTWAFFAAASPAAQRLPERPSRPPAPDPRPPHEELEPVHLTLTLERLREFEGPGEDNGHTNPAIARRQGLPAPLAQGELSVATIARILLNRFGAGWQVGGTLDCRILRPSYAGETVTARGQVVDVRATHAHCRVWVENERGEVTVTGTASARLDVSA
ncbi:MAG: MaoC family dehydratase [Chloroflexi bacterium]|nr:MaoC family dehydratase [Chloroflexota bacterium]